MSISPVNIYQDIIALSCLPLSDNLRQSCLLQRLQQAYLHGHILPILVITLSQRPRTFDTAASVSNVWC